MDIMVDHLADSHGIILRRDVIAAGYADKHLHRARRAGRIVRLRQGAYVLAPVWTEADGVGEHLLLVRAVARLYDDRVAVSHQSACLLQGGPNWGLDLRTAHLTSLTGVGERRAALVTHHRGATRVNDVTRHEGGWITSPVRTALDTASTAHRDAAVAVLDWYLHHGLVTREQLEAGFASRHQWPGSLLLHARLGLSDGRSESVGETRFRLFCLDHELPRPELQWAVTDHTGRVLFRVDFAWPALGLIVEFDGKQKYLRLRSEGESIEETVLREKRREDRIRELTGFRVIRLTWSDLENARATLHRFHEATRRQAA